MDAVLNGAYNLYCGRRTQRKVGEESFNERMQGKDGEKEYIERNDWKDGEEGLREMMERNDMN